MENFIKLMLAFGIGLLLVLLAMPKVIPFLHKMKFGQVEREEGLESHKKKGGTPTMGGVVFVLAAVIAAFVVNYKNITNPNLILITIVLVGYSLIGFIDDALIILKHQIESMAKILDASYFGSRMLFVSRKFCTWFYNRSDYSNCESKY